MSCSQSTMYPTMTMNLQCWVLVQSPLTLLMGWHLNKTAKKYQHTWRGIPTLKQPSHLYNPRHLACEHIFLALLKKKSKCKLLDSHQPSAKNTSIPTMRTFHYHCSHLGMYRHIHRKTKSTTSFTVKKIRDPAWNYRLQAGEPQQEAFQSWVLSSEVSSSCCGKQQAAQSNWGWWPHSDSPVHIVIRQENTATAQECGQCDFTAPIVKLDGLKQAWLSLPAFWKDGRGRMKEARGQDWINLIVIHIIV